jgi:hypothetical protein
LRKNLFIPIDEMFLDAFAESIDAATDFFAVVQL